MNQTERIKYMEQILNESTSAVNALADALEQYLAVLPALDALKAYYSSPLWRQDYEDDEAGKLPADLKRGVLSEDAVYNLLYEHQLLMEALKSLSHDAE